METSQSVPIRLQPSNVRPLAYRILSKKHGLNVKTDALGVLAELIGHRFGLDWKGAQSQQFMEDIAKAWKSEDRGLFIDGQGLRFVVREMSKSATSSAAASRTNSIVKATRSDTLMDEDEAQVPIDWSLFFRVINPPDQPHFVFDKARRQFSLLGSTKTMSFSEKLSHVLQAKTNLFLSRYALITDRLSRHQDFQKPTFSALSSISNSGYTGPTHEITPIKNLLGRDNTRFSLFGLLSQSANGEYILEDATDYIELDFGHATKADDAFFALGMFVVINGIYSASGGKSNTLPDYLGGLMHVHEISQPQIEKRDACLEAYGNIDFLGVHKDTNLDAKGNRTASSATQVLRVTKKYRRKLAEIEKSLPDHQMLFLGSNCYLDDHRVMEGLSKFFLNLNQKLQDDADGGLSSDTSPLLIVMTGSFISVPLTSDTSGLGVSSSERYKGLFDNLARILSKFKLITQSCKLLLIPGKNDPWQSTYSLGCTLLNYLPQKPIPNVFLSRLERTFASGNIIAGWNPVRVNYLSQELVILKDELMSKFKRSDIIFPQDLAKDREAMELESQLDHDQRISHKVHNSTEKDMISTKVRQSRKFVRTLLDQGNLEPFLGDSRLVDTVYEHVLRIEPLPTILVLHDVTFGNFEVMYQGCKVVNIASLVTGRTLNYAEYHPSRRAFSFRQIYL